MGKEANLSMHNMCRKLIQRWIDWQNPW